MNIRIAALSDLDCIDSYDEHISRTELTTSIRLGRVYVAEEDGQLIGWMRYNLFWDNTPFLNMICFLDDYQRRGYGRQMLSFWEMNMKAEGFESVMTSTVSEEYSQHFYTKLGYRTIGGFLQDKEPYEIIMMKSL